MSVSEQKTHAEIVAEMRNRAKRPDFVSQDVLKSCADELDAAHKREMVELRKQVGNAAKLREALVSVQKKIHYLIGSLNVPNSLVANRMEINGIINAALAAPARNCDVGTAREQLERFGKFCHANINMEGCGGNCPAFRTTRNDCELVWAQMPYEEGGAK